ncbi:M20 family metallopeptidase [Terriglobus aquaticus]|uniref:M20 family metallopeptidase n=1 Tax=Terriglobus aquaticus TaxID=940139 RepID=A0ABW9KMY8_9BACT|nr:M20 family metallopeptidase [Terriglobus aquaticus]
MSPESQQIRAAVEARQPEMLTRLRALVEIESPSDAPAAVNRAADQVEQWAQAAGAHVLRHPQESFGDVTEVWFEPRTPQPAGTKPLLLLGHLDTVWPLGTLARMPWREDPDRDSNPRLWGPGVLDMKAGVLMAITAIASVQQVSDLARPLILLLNPDEEVGSPVSREHTERLGALAEAVFVLEPAQGMPGSRDNAAYKTARKGIGNYRVEVAGVAAHSGVDFAKGRSAVLELARLLPRIAELSEADKDFGITVNPGVIGGGTRSNVVAASAWAEIDVRVPIVADADRIHATLTGLAAHDPGCTVQITGGLNRPPMERSTGTVALFERARALALELGFELNEAATGGGSDGNFTAALGTPTLDGMGPVGEGAHAAHESLLTDHLIPRTALLAAMIAST